MIIVSIYKDEMRTLWIKTNAAFALVCTCALAGLSWWKSGRADWSVIGIISTLATILFALRSYLVFRAEKQFRGRNMPTQAFNTHSEIGTSMSHLSEYSSGEDFKIYDYIASCHSLEANPKSAAVCFENLEEVETLDDFLGETLAQVRTDFISATEDARSSDALHYARVFKMLTALKTELSKLSKVDAF